MENVKLLPSDEYTEVENRVYLNPNLQVEQADKFIENYRTNQQAANQEIAQQTESLGTSVPSNEGGLLGAESYWASRYQTPQANSVAQNLRAAAQAAALNEALANEQAMWKQRYNDAYRAYQNRQNVKANRVYNGDNQSSWSGEIDLTPTDETSDNVTPDDTQPQAPPKESDYMITSEEQNQKIEEQTGIPAWWVNILKIFG